MDQHYWEKRYQNNNTGWDVGYPVTPIKDYIDQLNNKNLKILIPGAGNGYEASYLFDHNFKNIHILDIAKPPLDTFKSKHPNFPKSHILHQNFFEVENTYDLIIEHTFFCALQPKLREEYVKQMHKLLTPKGKLVGLLFDFVEEKSEPPFGGSYGEYLSLFKHYFEINKLEKSYNSIQPRAEKELFFIFTKKEV